MSKHRHNKADMDACSCFDLGIVTVNRPSYMERLEKVSG